MINPYVEAIRRAELTRRTGKVHCLTGVSIESDGPHVLVGEVCEIALKSPARVLKAEVVGLKDNRVLLMPYGPVQGIATGNTVTATGQLPQIAVGDALLGRVINAFGEPLDHKPAPVLSRTRPLKSVPINPMSRPRIDTILETGIRGIDSLLTLGRGQRVGIFSGSGVGKSTLLGMIARHVQADINVIALIGERGREVREFIDKHLGNEGLARSVVIAATSDQPALARARAAWAATAIAEYFRDAGLHVLLTMDSITRFAMARREIGLSSGEPPTARGYTPTVFAELPELCERCGTTESGGSITALYTVLVEGDDFNEPVSDIMRATLDGHIMLTRRLAQQGHYPAIDILQSTSRLLTDLASEPQIGLVHATVEALAEYEQNRQMIAMGAYGEGSNPAIDRAISLHLPLQRFLRQSHHDSTSRQDAMARLHTILQHRSAGDDHVHA